MDHLRKTKLTSLKVHRSKQEVSAQRKEPQSHVMMSTSTDTVQQLDLNIIITNKEQILSSYPDIFKGIGRFCGPLCHIQVNSNITSKMNPMSTGAYSSQRGLQKRNRQDASSRYHQAS